MLALNSTGEWICNSAVSVELDTADAATGTYTLLGDNGENTMADGETATPTETGSPTTSLGVARPPPRTSSGRPRDWRPELRCSRRAGIAAPRGAPVDPLQEERLAAESGPSRCGSAVSGLTVGDLRGFLSLLGESAFDARNGENYKIPHDPRPPGSREQASSSGVRRRRSSLWLRWRHTLRPGATLDTAADRWYAPHRRSPTTSRRRSSSFVSIPLTRSNSATAGRSR